MPSSFSIIIPAYNEAARLGRTLCTVFAYLNVDAPDSEVIVVDDGSTDNTAEIVQQSFLDARPTVPARFLRSPVNRGKGHAVRLGLLAAQKPVALFSDADLSTPITETPKLITPVQSGECDVAFGSRALDRSLIGIHQTWRREQGGRVFNFVVRLATRLPFWDTQCGFKAFRMEVCRPIIEVANIDRFGFDVELLYVAHRAGLRLRELPVRWDHYDGSKLSVLRDTLPALREVNTIRRQTRRGFYDEAINAARNLAAAAEYERVRIPASGDSDASESDISPELASAARRI